MPGPSGAFVLAGRAGNSSAGPEQSCARLTVIVINLRAEGPLLHSVLIKTRQLALGMAGGQEGNDFFSNGEGRQGGGIRVQLVSSRAKHSVDLSASWVRVWELSEVLGVTGPEGVQRASKRGAWVARPGSRPTVPSGALQAGPSRPEAKLCRSCLSAFDLSSGPCLLICGTGMIIPTSLSFHIV